MTARYAVAGAIATITLDSPANRNALSAALVAELTAGLDTAGDDPGVRAIVLTHTGSTFCAGADLKEQSAEGGPEAGTRRLVALLRRLVGHPKPIVARIAGHVRAGGVGIVGACDIAVAGPDASFAFSEVRLGLSPAMISMTTLPRMSARAASRYFLTGETFGPLEAAACGLVTVAAADLDAELAVITQALRAASPQGLRATKPLTTRAAMAALDESADDMQRLSAELFGSDEGREGMRAFLDKRPPRWTL